VEQVEQVEPESAVVDGGGLAWQEFAVHARLYGKVVRIRSDARCYGILAVPFRWYYRCSGGVRWRCTLAVYASDVCQFRERRKWTDCERGRVLGGGKGGIRTHLVI